MFGRLILDLSSGILVLKSLFAAHDCVNPVGTRQWVSVLRRIILSIATHLLVDRRPDVQAITDMASVQ